VKDLRPMSGAVADLAQALAAEGEQLTKRHSAQFRVSVQGAPRDLHPIVREEGFLIGREALANAFNHSAAANIEVWSKPGAGTEIDVRVPAEVAYRPSQAATRGWRFRLGAAS